MPEDEARRLFSGDSLQGLVSRTITEEVIDRTLQRLRQIAKGEAGKKAVAKTEPTAEAPAKSKAPAKAKAAKSPKAAKPSTKEKGSEDE